MSNLNQPKIVESQNLKAKNFAKNINIAINLAKNCPCGELVEDCSYPNCGSGGETLPETKAEKTLCEDCPSKEDCRRYGCQHGD